MTRVTQKPATGRGIQSELEPEGVFGVKRVTLLKARVSIISSAEMDPLHSSFPIMWLEISMFIPDVPP
jgi:hypothetical protein